MTFTLSILRYNPEHHIIICEVHGHAILPSSLQGHIGSVKLHPELNHEQAVLASKQAFAIPGAAKNWDEVEPVQGPITPIDGLRLYTDAVQCTYPGCDEGSGAYIRTGKAGHKNVLQHIRQSHGIKRRAEPDSQYTQSVYAQRFTTAATSSSSDGAPGSTHQQSFFTVVPPEAGTQCTHAGDNYILTQGRVAPPPYQALKEAYAQQKVQREAVLPMEDDRMTAPWLLGTRCLDVLKTSSGRPMEWAALSALLATPIKDEAPVEHALWRVVGTMARVYQLANEQTPAWLRAAVMREEPDKAPKGFLDNYVDYGTKHAYGLRRIFMFAYRARLATELPAGWVLNKKCQRNLDLLVAELEVQSEAIDAPSSWVDLAQQGREESRLDTLGELCHNFWIALVEQTAQYDPLKSVALITAVAALVVSNDRLLKCYEFASELSAIKKMARLAMVYKIHWRVVTEGLEHPGQDEVPGAESCASSALDDLESKHCVVDWVTELTRTHLSISIPSAMQWIITTNQRLANYRYGDTLESFVYWDAVSGTLRCRHVSLDMLEYRKLVQKMYQDAKAKLERILFVDDLKQAPEIPWAQLQDNPSITEANYNIFDPRFSPCLAQSESFILHQWDELKPPLPPKFATIKGWTHAGTIVEYGGAVQHFLHALLPLIHLVKGQPARGPELLSLHVTNTHNNELRNLFVLDGCIVIILRWSKNQHLGRAPSLSYRVLPREVSTLLALYLWLVRPYYQVTQSYARTINPDGKDDSARAESPLLWSDATGAQYKDGNILSKALAGASQAQLGISIGIGMWRHITIAIGRRLLGIQNLIDAPDADDVSMRLAAKEAEMLEEKSGHSVATGIGAYAKSAWSMFQAYDTFSVHRRESQRLHVVQGWAQDAGGTPIELPDDVLGWIASTGAVTLLDDPARTAADRIRETRSMMVPKNILQQLLGQSATFRDGQEEAFKLILAQRSPIVYVAGTAAGKSLAFLLSAVIDQVVVVVVPLLELQRDLVNRCRDLKIPCQRFDSQNPRLVGFERGILLAMPEAVNKSGFREAIGGLVQSNKLQYIFIDEFHYAFSRDLEYRRDLACLPRYLNLGARVCLLTATLPPSLEEKAWNMLKITPAPKHVVRLPTQRKNIRYVVERPIPASQYSSQSPISEVVSGYIERMRGRKVLVFVPYRDMAESVSESLMGAYVHAKMRSHEKEKQLASFAQGDVNILVATSCIGEGWHCDGIDLVVHVCPTDTLMAYAQQSGRAGRTGAGATALLLDMGDRNGFLWRRTPKEQAPMLRYLQTQDCRRAVMSEYLDGQAMQCQEGDAKCDVCEHRDTAASPGPSTMDSAVAAIVAKERRQFDAADSDAAGFMESTQVVPETDLDALDDGAAKVVPSTLDSSVADGDNAGEGDESLHEWTEIATETDYGDADFHVLSDPAEHEYRAGVDPSYNRAVSMLPSSRAAPVGQQRSPSKRMRERSSSPLPVSTPTKMRRSSSSRGARPAMRTTVTSPLARLKTKPGGTEPIVAELFSSTSSQSTSAPIHTPATSADEPMPRDRRPRLKAPRVAAPSFKLPDRPVTSDAAKTSAASLKKTLPVESPAKSTSAASFRKPLAPSRPVSSDAVGVPAAMSMASFKEAPRVDRPLTNIVAGTSTASAGRPLQTLPPHQPSRPGPAENGDPAQRLSAAQHDVRMAKEMMEKGIPAFIEFWEINCPICWCDTPDPREGDWRHDPDQCKSAIKHRPFIVQYCKPLKHPNGYCWSCLLPHKFCAQYRGTNASDWKYNASALCTHPFVMKRLFYAVWTLKNTQPSAAIRSRTRREAGVDLEPKTRPSNFAGYFKFYQQLGDCNFPRELWTLYHMSVDLRLISRPL